MFCCHFNFFKFLNKKLNFTVGANFVYKGDKPVYAMPLLRQYW